MKHIITQIQTETTQAVTQLLEEAGLKEKNILVVGCSSSEVASFSIGSHSSEEIGTVIYQTIESIIKPHGIYLAAQCCEHLNRALIIEEEAMEYYGYEEVNVVPRLKAGGSFAAAAYAGMEHPAAVEAVRAHAGMDIGDTLIGMHLKAVAVPVRIQTKQIGGARVVCAKTRAKYIGGERASYKIPILPRPQ